MSDFRLVYNIFHFFQVMRWKDYLHIPKHEISQESADLIRGLCRDAESRLGSGEGGADEIKRQPFFNGIDFSQPIRTIEAPWKPALMNDYDTSNFDPIPDRNSDNEDNDFDDYNNGNNDFYGFTFRRFLTNGGPSPQFFIGNKSSSSSTSTPSTSTNLTMTSSKNTETTETTSKSAAPDPVYV